MDFTTINWTAGNESLFFVGPEAIPWDMSIQYVGWQAVIYQYGWWLMVVLGVLMVAFLYTKHFVLAIILTIGLAVNIWWLAYAGIPDVALISSRAIFGLLIGFVWIYLLQSKRVRYVGSSNL